MSKGTPNVLHTSAGCGRERDTRESAADRPSVSRACGWHRAFLGGLSQETGPLRDQAPPFLARCSVDAQAFLRTRKQSRRHLNLRGARRIHVIPAEHDLTGSDDAARLSRRYHLRRGGRISSNKTEQAMHHATPASGHTAKLIGAGAPEHVSPISAVMRFLASLGRAIAHGGHQHAIVKPYQGHSWRDSTERNQQRSDVRPSIVAVWLGKVPWTISPSVMPSTRRSSSCACQWEA